MHKRFTQQASMHLTEEQVKNKFFPLLFSRLALSFALRKIGYGSEIKTKASFYFVFLSPCTIFALR